MQITTKQLLRVLHVISWIIFIGLCIEAGGIIFNAFFTLVLNPVGAKNFWMEVDLSVLYAYDPGYFFVITALMSIAAVLKAIMFYLIVKLLYDKTLSINQPFNTKVKRFIMNIAWLALGIGLFSAWGFNYSDWLIKKGVAMPDIQYLRLGGADVWLFMGVTLLVIAHVFKRGIEIQSENDLTI
jgi:hypothetical protein